MSRIRHFTRRPLLAVAVALLLTPFAVTASPADEVPFNVSYTGTLVPIPVNLSGGPAGASIVDAQARGSFGASMTHIVTEWVPGSGTCDKAGYDYYMLLHAAVVVTFSNDDQLVGSGFIGHGDLSGWMCMNASNGYFEGAATGEFKGGTGRFEGANGTFTSPFSGQNLTLFTLGYATGPITGSITGTLTLQ